MPESDSVDIMKRYRQRFSAGLSWRGILGVSVTLLLAAAIWVVMPTIIEWRIAQQIEAAGGEVGYEYQGPRWIPTSMHGRSPSCIASQM